MLPAPHEPSRPAVPIRALLALTFVAAALLRFWALPQGIPFNIGVDEPEIMERSVRMIRTGDFNPHFFDYPSLYLYVQAVVVIARYVSGAMHGAWSSLAQAPTWDFYLWGRAVTAAAGTLTVWVVHRIGSRWNERTGLFAAVALAVMPLHVRESHYVLTDVPATLFVTLTFLCTLRALEAPRLSRFAIAGAMAGLATATKYNGGLAVVMPLAACLMVKELRPSRLIGLLAVAGACGAAFLVTAPYTLLDLPSFLNGFAQLSAVYRDTSIVGGPIWLIYVKHLRIAFGWAGGALVAASFALGAVRLAAGPDRPKWFLVLSFPLLYFSFISHQHIVFARYLLPLVPSLCVLAALTLVAIIDALSRLKGPGGIRNALAIAVALVVLAPPALGACNYDRDASMVWTNAQAYEWIMANVPKDASITIESRGLLLPYHAGVRNVKQLRLEPSVESADYLVASSQCYGPYLDDPARFPGEYADYVRIFRATQEVARFPPSHEHPGPDLRILKVVR